MSVVSEVASWFGKKRNQEVIDPMVEHNLEQARKLKEGVANAMQGVIEATGLGRVVLSSRLWWC